MNWIHDVILDLIRQARHVMALPLRGDDHGTSGVYRFHCVAALLSASIVMGGLQFIDWDQDLQIVKGEWRLMMGPPAPKISLTSPVRTLPHRFPARTYMPSRREGSASLSIDKVRFEPEQDLVEIHDDRVWWESDHDVGDSENDHLVHRSLAVPLRRLIELVSAEGGILEVQDSFRDQGIHSPRSLHRQGRAVDLTCDELGLERLAKLAWAAGFDWVYYEAPKRGGHHVHASVRPH
jgi:hypothetical protein